MKKLSTVFMLFAGTLLLASCSKSSDNNNNTKTATVRMHLTDGPSSIYDAVYIDVQQVSVQTDDSTWTTVNVIHPGVYNLLTLRNGMDTLIANADIPAGHIAQMRLILGSNNSVVVNGTSYALTTPSAQESGLKLNINQTLTAGISYDLWIDFDVAASIHQTGSGKYMLKPVMRAYTVATDGEIKGYILPLSALATVSITNGTDTFMALPDATGYFMIRGLPEGTYSLTAVATIGTYIPYVMSSVNVHYGSVTDVGTITLTP